MARQSGQRTEVGEVIWGSRAWNIVQNLGLGYRKVLGYETCDLAEFKSGQLIGTQGTISR